MRNKPIFKSDAKPVGYPTIRVTVVHIRRNHGSPWEPAVMIYGQTQNIAVDTQGHMIPAPIYDYNEHADAGAFVLQGSD